MNLMKLKSNPAFKNQLNKVLTSVDDKERGPPFNRTLIKKDLDSQIFAMRYKSEEIVNQVKTVPDSSSSSRGLQ